MQGDNIIKQIEQDKAQAERYLISGKRDGSGYSKAVEVAEKQITPCQKTILAARRELEKEKKYGNSRHWVIKTQFIFNRLAEKNHLSVDWLSESKIKREWKSLIFLVSEIYARIDKTVDG